MRNQLRTLLTKYKNPTDVIKMACQIIKQHKIQNPTIGYVAGKVTADGVNAISKNLATMNAFTDSLSKKYPSMQIFSAADVFPKPQYWLDTIINSDHKKEFYEQWGSIHDCGTTDMFFMPGWEKSKGASFEHEYALKHNINIHGD